jgi:hypothetical protein
VTDYSSGTPWAEPEMFEIRTGMQGKQHAVHIATEYLRTAHAEIAQMIYDEHGIDPTGISSSTSGYITLQTSEADVAAGLYEEDNPTTQQIMNGPPQRSVKYLRGMERIRQWAESYNAGAKPVSRIARLRSQVAMRRNYTDDHYDSS